VDDIEKLQDGLRAAAEAQIEAHYVFCRSRVHWRQASAVTLCGCITTRVVVTPLAACPVKRVSGGLLRA
jgi:hypothetical protein